MNKIKYAQSAAFLLILTIVFTIFRFTDLSRSLFDSQIVVNWYSIAGLVTDLILCVVLLLKQKGMVLACAVGIKAVPEVAVMFSKHKITQLNDILYVASFLLLVAMLLFMISKKENPITKVCKKLFFLPALVGLTGIVVYIVKFVPWLKKLGYADSIFSMVFMSEFCKLIYALVLLLAAYWAAYGMTTKEKISILTQATEELKDDFRIWTEELSLKKQNPGFEKLISLEEFIPSVYTASGEIARKDLGGHYEIKFWRKEWDSATSSDVWRAKPVKKIVLSNELKKKAREDESLKDYLDKDGNIVVIKDFNVSSDTAVLLRGGETVHAVNNFNIDKVNSYPMKFECDTILDFVYGK